MDNADLEFCNSVIPAKAGIHRDYSILLNGSPTKPGMTKEMAELAANCT